MKQFKLTFLLIIFVWGGGNKVYAYYDIAVANDDGVTIYYNYIHEGKELQVTYQTDDAGSGYTSVTTLNIPATVTYMGCPRNVTSIRTDAFHGCEKLTSVTIPNSVTGIAQDAFRGCSGLKKVIVSDIAAWCNIKFGDVYSNPLYYAKHLYSDENTEITNLVIPDGVTSIQYAVFYGCSGLTSVEIPNSVTRIGTGAFYGCSGLTSVEIPNSVTSIGSYAFYSCSGLTSIEIPNSVTNIEEYTFYNCSGLTSVEIPNSVKSIGDLAFEGCSGLTSIEIPNSVTSIGEYAFNGCSGLTSVSIKSNSIVSKSNLKTIFGEQVTKYIIGDDVTRIGPYAFNNCSGLTSVKIPNSVTSIGVRAFSGCSGLKKVIVSDIAAWCNISFGDGDSNPLYYAKHLYSDENTEITNLVIPDGVTSIGGVAFYGCSGLTSVKIPNSVTSIGEYAFNGCSGLTSVEIPNSVTSIGNYAFEGCSGLKKVIVKDIAAWCEINFGNEYANPLYYAKHLYSDENTEITNLVIPDGVTSIGQYAFYNCSGLTSVEIPNSVTSIGNYAFSGCSGLTSVEIPNNVTSIGTSAFQGCSGLTSIVIPSGVESIGESAFNNCSSLTSVTMLRETLVEITSNTFSNRANATLRVPYNSKKAYQKAYYWKEFKKIISVFPTSPLIDFAETSTKTLCVDKWDEDEDGELSQIEASLVTDLGSTFQSKRNITSFDELQYFTGLKYITSNAFNGCNALTSIIIPSNVTSINYNAFKYCSNLTSVTINSNSIVSKEYSTSSNLKTIFGEQVTQYTICDGATSIGDYAFYGCSGLNSVTIPNSVTTIGYHAFYNCSGLTSIEIPNSVTSIGGYAFQNCTGLTSIEIPNSVTSIGSYAFRNCTGLTSVTIPNSVETIDWYAFYDCSSLTSVTIGNRVTSIGDYAFQNCSGLKKVIVKDIAAWCEINFGNEYANPLYYAKHLYSDENTEITNLVIPDGETSIEGDAFSGCSGLTSIEIPNSVTNIGQNAFSGCSSLTSVTIKSNSIASNDYSTSSNLKTIFGEQVTEYIIGDDVTSIGSSAFYQCSNLSSVTIGTGVTSIGEGAFAWSGLTAIDIPNSVTSIGDYAFLRCGTLSSVTIPNSMVSIGNGAFYACLSLQSISIPNSVVNIGEQAFFCCIGLTSVTIPNSVTSIGNEAFYNCTELTSVTINSNSIMSNNVPLGNIFGGQVTEYIIGDDVTSIGNNAFSFSEMITSIVIPSSVESIGYGLFYSCSSLESVTVEQGNPVYDSRNNCNAIIETATNTLLNGCKNTVIPNSVTSIGNLAFEGCSGLTSIEIPNSVTSIGNEAFEGCSGLTSIEIPNSVTSIGDNVFQYCYRLTAIIVENATPFSIGSIGSTNANLYIPKGSKAAYQAADNWKDFKAIKEYPDGDVNQDGATDVVDVVDIARYVVDTPAETFDVFLADLNSDKTVNIADAVVLVNDIAGNTKWARGMMAPQNNTFSDVLSLTANDDNSLSLQLRGDGRYTAFQFDLLLPNDMDMMQMCLNKQRKQKHQLIYNKVGDNHYRVVAMSTSNNEFNGSSGELLNIVPDGFATDGIIVDNIHFVTAQGADVKFDAITLGAGNSGTVTDIDHPDTNINRQHTIYNMNGQRLNSPHKGLNIIDGKKVLIK